MQRLNQDAAKSIAAGREVGIQISDDDAIKWITIHPAWTLDLDRQIGSIEPGKNADVVLWSGNPFSIYSRAEKVWIDGALMFDRLDRTEQWRTDFELGFVPVTGGR
jgi:imidazolonepropionase-like amidohydrolase